MFLRHTSRLDHETSLSDHHTRQSDHNPDQTTTSEYHTGPSSRPDHQIRPSDHNTTAYPDHQFRLPHQTTGYHPWRISFQSAQHTQPLEMIQVRCILYGLGRGWYIELWMNLAKHTFHTRSAWSFRIIFRLKLIVVRLVSEFPGLVRASPSLSLKMGSFAGVRSAIRVRLLGIGSAFWTRPSFYKTVRLHLFAPFSGGLRHTAAFVVVVVVVVFTTTSRLVAPNLNWSTTLHLIVYALVKWSFHPQGSTRQWLF